MIPLSVNDLALFSLGVATSTVAGLVWFLSKVEATYRSPKALVATPLNERNTENPTPNDSSTENEGAKSAAPKEKAAPQRSSRVECLLSAFFLFVVLLVILLLFAAEITHANQVALSKRAAVFSAIAAAGLSIWAGIWLFPKLWRFEMQMLGILPIKEAVAITGTIFALFAGKVAVLSLSKSTNSNMAAVYGQIYRNDRDASDSEVSAPNLMRLYVGSDVAFMPDKAQKATRSLVRTDFDDRTGIAKAYWQHRLAFYLSYVPARPNEDAPDAIAKTLPDVDSLTTFLEAPTGPESRAIQLSRGFNHVTNVFNNMHQVYDYGSRGVIPLGDSETWLGYFEDFGPHPIVLAVVANWLERTYMTRPFYAIAEFRISGKRELFNFLGKCEANPEAIELGRELAKQGVLQEGQDKKFERLCPTFFPRMALFIEENASRAKMNPDSLYLALAHAAVFDEFIVGNPDYSKRVKDLVADVNHRKLETIDSIPERFKRE